MFPDKAVGRTGSDGASVTSVCCHRLVVRAADGAVSWARFLVLHRRGDDGAEVLIGSGCEADRRAAMRSALRMADRLKGHARHHA